MADAGWTLVVHGGARTIDQGQEDRNRAGCIAAAEAGASVLTSGGDAVEAVEAAIRVLEDDPTFNAGTGSVLNADGDVENDAAIMDGGDLRLGGVGALKGYRNPISVARRMLAELPTLLVGEGARAYAASIGAEAQVARAANAPVPDTACSDTVGCVARDVHGKVAAGTSTGGLPGKRVGRVGDSPLPGCGLYADNMLGAISLSGDGESISRLALGLRTLFRTGALTPWKSAELALDDLTRVGGEAGIILLSPSGEPGVAHNSDHFAVALASDRNPSPIGAVSARELQAALGVMA